jgi:undecaprenyl-diphosphatase
MNIDAFLTHLINLPAGHVPPLDWIMLFLAKIAVYLLVLAVAMRWYWPGDRGFERHVVVSCGLAAGLGLAANQVILLFYDRLRPYEANVTHALLPPNGDPSFPSDHATLAFAIAAMLAVKRHRWAPWFLIAATLIALSRIYVGVHYVSDVLGGCAIGCLAAVALNFVYRRDSAIDRRLVSIL